MTTLNTIIEKEKKDYAVIKHIAEIADKHCPDLGVEHQATPAIDIINRFVTTAIQRAYEAGQSEERAKERERIKKEVEKLKVPFMDAYQEHALDRVILEVLTPDKPTDA